MATYYSSIKGMKTAKVGTILPWSGDGGTGFLSSNIPRGWIVCDGQTHTASDYPLLASILGDTYGGDMTKAAGGHYTFPYVDTVDGSNTATFRVPNISNKLLVDLEPTHLDETKYNQGQTNWKDAVIDNTGKKLGALIDGYGEVAASVIKTSWSANSDIDFTLNLSGNLYLKFTNMTLTAPDFLETVYTLGRKLGVNHTPSHGHTDSIQSVKDDQKGAMIFQTDAGIEMDGTETFTNGCSASITPFNCKFKSANPHSWRNGHITMSYFGNADYEQTLPRTGSFMEYTTDSVNVGKNYWDTVPAGASNWRGATRGAGPKEEVYTQTIPGMENTDQIVDTTPVDTHSVPAQTGMFPRPMSERNRPNFYGYTPKDGTTPTRADGLKDSPEMRPAKVVPGCTLTENSNEIILPDGTNISQQYGTGSDAWTQWDLIRPLMYVTTTNTVDKYKWIPEGTWIQSIEWVKDAGNTAAGGNYKLTLNQSMGGGTTDAAGGWGSQANVSLTFRDGTWPTSMNQGRENKNPLEQSFRPHNHGGFEIAQTLGTMVGPPSHTASNADGSSLQAESIENALNIAVDTTQPSLTMTFIIKAY